MFVSVFAYGVLVYLRLGALYLTRRLIKTGLGCESNPFMKGIEKPSAGFWLCQAVILFSLFLIFFFAFSPAAVFVVLFIFWIDFQHDWELTMIAEKIEQRGLVVK